MAGGYGTRLRPITKVVNKSFLPVGRKPLIYYPLETLREAGIRNILIICGPEHTDQYFKLLGTGRGLGVKLSYTIQPKPIGIAHGLGLARSFAEGKNVALILGDNIFEENFKEAVRDFKKQKTGAKLVLARVNDPERFGVVEFASDGRRIKGIIEKPSKPKTKWITTGFYMYDKRVFDIIKGLKPSRRREYEITDVNNFYVTEGTAAFVKTKKFWIDAGTFDSLFRANVAAMRFKK